MAVKVIQHQGAGYSSNLAVAREKMIGLASLHPNVVGSPSLLSCQWCLFVCCGWYEVCVVDRLSSLDDSLSARSSYMRSRQKRCLETAQITKEPTI